jgi:polysaccharide biosynthesis protein PslH
VEWRKMRRYERQACARAKLTVAVSEVDRLRLAELAPGSNICAIPTGVDTEYFAPSALPEKPASLVFTGSMDWYPNEDAVLYFVEAILPAVVREIPETSLAVVGRNPSARLRSVCSNAHVSVTGTVEDVRPYIQAAAVYVVPLRIGGGTRLKIFEALAMAKAVVSTRVGAEGLPLEPGKHFALADRPTDFARKIVSLLRDPERRRTLGAAGRNLVEERFSWAKVAREFENRCTEVVGDHAR